MITTNKIKEERFEFVFYINNNIICQRYFDIFNFNENSVNSTKEIKQLMDDLIGFNNNGLLSSCGIIPDYLKQKSKDLLWKHYNPYFDSEFRRENGIENQIVEQPIKQKRSINYQFEIKVDKKILTKGEFDGSYFQAPSAIYQINIRDIQQQIIGKIRTALSRKNYTIDDELVAIKEEISELSSAQ